MSVSNLLMNIALEQDRERWDFGPPKTSSPLLASVEISHTVEGTFWARKSVSERRLLCMLVEKGGKL